MDTQKNIVHYRQAGVKLLCGDCVVNSYSSTRIYEVTCPKCIEIHKKQFPLIAAAIDNFLSYLPKNFENFCTSTSDIVKNIKEFKKYQVDEIAHRKSMKTPEDYEQEIAELKAGLAYREGQLEDCMAEIHHQEIKKGISVCVDEIILDLERSLHNLEQANGRIDKLTIMDWQLKRVEIISIIGKIKTQVLKFQGIFIPD